ncbi:MAG: hypothetical protein IJY23_05125 [Clostridia bacterium]|nr:hypothetical protein [Clostridia bacterium]
MKKLSKILVLLLSVALVCAGLIIAVSADTTTNVAKIGDTEYATLAEAFDVANAVTDGTTTTITLINDVTVSATIKPTTSVTLDLNGHTLTNTTTAFAPQTDGTTFTITGEGSISAGHTLIQYKEWSASANLPNRNVNVIGTGDGIYIKYLKDAATSTDGKLISMDAGTWTFKNLEIEATINRINSTTDTTAKADQLFWVWNAETLTDLMINFDNVDMTVGSNTSSSAVIFARYCKISMNDCNITTKNSIPVFTTTNNVTMTPDDKLTDVENVIEITNSNIYSSASLLGGYGYADGDFLIKNSTVNISSGVSLKENLNNSAIVLDNSVWNCRGTSYILRSLNMLLKNGSAITYDTTTATPTAIYSTTANDSSLHTYPIVNGVTINKNMIIFEGARVDYNVYMAIVSGGVSNGRMAFEDGTAINAEEEPTYVFAYDPEGNADIPFVVVKAADAENYASAPSFAEHTYKYLYTNPTTSVHWNPNGVVGNETVNGNDVWTRYNDLANSTGTAPTYIFVKTGIKQDQYNVFVYDVDFAADSLNGLANMSVGLHARSSSSPGSGSGRHTQIFKITNGVINTSGYLTGGASSSVALELGEWNHLTVVIDTTKETTGTAYVYVNGVYLGTRTAYTADDAYLAGPRFDVTATDKDRLSLTVDNVAVRVYGALSDTVTPTAIADKGASYLIDGGAAWNAGAVNNNLTVNGTAYSTIDEALTAATLAGTTAQLNSPVSIEQTVTVNGTIATNGYEIPLSENTIPYTVAYDTDGTTPLSYTFDNSLTATVNLIFSYNGNSSVSNEFAIGDSFAEFYSSVITTAVLVNKTADNHFESRELLGWTLTESGTEIVLTEVLTKEFAGENDGEEVTLYPVFSESEQKFTWVVTNTNGFVRGGEDTVITTAVWNNTIKLTYGETLVLQQNIVAVNAFNSNSKGSSETKTLGLDLNGHTLTVDPHYTAATIPNAANKKIFGFWKVLVGETLNVYSTNEGGKIESFGAEKADFSGGLLFVMDAQASGNRDVIANANRSTDYSALNIGTFGDIPGSNLTLCAGGIIDLDDGDSTCTVTMDGVTAIKNSYDCSFISQRAYYGKLDVKNCNLILTCGYTSVIMENASGSKATDSNGDTVYSAATVTFENCTIIHSANGKDVVSGNNAFESITFKNCVTNGTINGKKTIVDEGTQYVTLGTTAKLASDVTAAKWNQPMTVDGNTMTVTFYTINDDRTEYVPNNYVIASYGYTGDAKIVLPTLTYKAVTEDDTVNVTYTGYDGATTNVLYAVGGNVVDYKLSNYEGKALTFEHNGTYQEDYATNLVADGTYVYTTTLANYTVLEANIKDLQANVSLYADFGVNLYIPSGYEEYVKVFNGDAEIAPTKTTSYLKYTITQLCNKASENVTFKITITEEGHSVDTTASVSIATYAEAVLGGEYTDADKVLVYYMLNYANEAAKYIGGAEDTAIATLLENNATVAAKYTVSAEYDEYIENQGLASVFDTVAIDLNGTPAFVLNLEAGFEGTVTVSYAKGKASREFNIAEASDEIVALTVEGMKAYNFGTVLTITAEGTLNGEAVAITGTYSLDTYVKDVETAGEDCAALAKALRAYAEVSELYKNQTLDDAIAEQAAAEDTPSGEETPAA